MNDLEQDLRGALRRAGDQVHPDVDRAWSELASAPRRRPGRSLVLLGAAAAAVLVVAVSFTLTGDDAQNVVTDSPTPTTTVLEENPIVLEGIPSEALAVTTDGRFVSINTSDSMTTELAEVTAANVLERNPTDPDELWFSECCEPAEGLLRSMSLTSGEIEDEGFGLDPAVDPSGASVALASTQGLRVVDIATGEESVYDQEAGGGIAAPAWVDEDTIAYQRILDGTWDLGILHLGEGAEPVEVVDGGGIAHVAAPVATDAGLLVARLCCADDEEDVITSEPLLLDPLTGDQLAPPPIDYQGEVVAQDVQDGWLLVTYADGRLVAHDLETGDSVGLAEDIRTATW